MWHVKNVEVVPVVVGVLGSVTKKLGQWIKKLGIRVRIGLLQKTTLLGTTRMLRRVLDFKVSGQLACSRLRDSRVH